MKMKQKREWRPRLANESYREGLNIYGAMCVQMRAPASTVGSAAGRVSGDRAGQHRCLPAAAGAGVILVLVAIYSFMFIHLDSGLTGAVAETNGNNI